MAKRTRTFVRSVESVVYELDDQRQAQLAEKRVRGGDVVVADMSVGYTKEDGNAKTLWRVGPGDEHFLTQTLQVHFNYMAPNSSSHGHGHQNEAVFYILEGEGYEEHDGQQFRWSSDDVVLVHTDSVHRHFNDSDKPAHVLVVKAKSSWMFMGLLQQRSSGPAGAPDPSPVPHEEKFGPRENWARIWTPNVESLAKLVRTKDLEWELTPDGHVKHLLNGNLSARCSSIDLYQQRIPAGASSSKHVHMADEVLYIQKGSGFSLHWEVEAEIAERYHARVAKEPTRHDFVAGDTVYIPQNTVHQHFSTDGEVLMLSAQNRLFRYMGYDNVSVLEPPSE